MQGMRCVSASWLQTSSETGRITAEGPNLQCVAKPRRFMVPNTQLDGSREFELNLRSGILQHSIQVLFKFRPWPIERCSLKLPTSLVLPSYYQLPLMLILQYETFASLHC